MFFSIFWPSELETVDKRIIQYLWNELALLLARNVPLPLQKPSRRHCESRAHFSIALDNFITCCIIFASSHEPMLLFDSKLWLTADVRLSDSLADEVRYPYAWLLICIPFSVTSLFEFKKDLTLTWSCFAVCRVMTSFESLNSLREQNKSLLKRLQEQTEKLYSLCPPKTLHTTFSKTDKTVQRRMPLVETNRDVITSVVIQSNPNHARVALSNVKLQTQESSSSRTSTTESLTPGNLFPCFAYVCVL